MKARNENGTIVLYRNGLPVNYSSETLGTPLVDFNTLPVETHKSEGFYRVEEPAFDQYTQELGEIYFNEINEVFTYPVLTRTIPLERPEIRISQLDFLQRFTKAERKAIRVAYKADANFEDDWYLVMAMDLVSKKHNRVIDLVALLVTKGILTQERATQILI